MSEHYVELGWSPSVIHLTLDNTDGKFTPDEPHVSAAPAPECRCHHPRSAHHGDYGQCLSGRPGGWFCTCPEFKGDA